MGSGIKTDGKIGIWRIIAKKHFLTSKSEMRHFWENIFWLEGSSGQVLPSAAAPPLLEISSSREFSGDSGRALLPTWEALPPTPTHPGNQMLLPGWGQVAWSLLFFFFCLDGTWTEPCTHHWKEDPCLWDPLMSPNTQPVVPRAFTEWVAMSSSQGILPT